MLTTTHPSTRPFAGLCAVALALLLLLPSGAARAQSVNLCVEEMSDEDIEQHTSRIVGELRSHRTHARAWRFGWLSAYTGIAAVSLAVLAPGIGRNAMSRDDRARRLGYLGAGIGATLAAARLAFYPMPDVWGARRIERMPTSTRRERIAQTRYAESVLTSAGAWQGLMTGSTSYVLALGWGAGWGGAITRRYNNPTSAALAFLGSPILGIATALTAPSWAAVSATRIRGGVCGHVYVEDREDPMGDEMSLDDEGLSDGDGAGDGEGEVGEDGEELYEKVADELRDERDRGAEDSLSGLAPEAASGPSVMVYPTLGGAGLVVTF